MICKLPSHIYLSALKFAPPSSWIHQHHNKEYSPEIKVIKGPSAGWGTCFRTVLVDRSPSALACWKDTIAASLTSGQIIILDAVTGSQMAVFSGHTNRVFSLTFLPNGTSLVSGSWDKSIKLWDMQTGGVIKTFQGHTRPVYSVSISVDCTTIASGSSDNTIRLWDIQTGECYLTIQQEDVVHSVHFFPLYPQHFISVSGDKVQEWNISGHQITPTYDGSHAAFSLDGAKFALCNGAVVQVQRSDSRRVVAEFYMDNPQPNHCCFSPDGRLVAIAAGDTAYVWDITHPEPCLIETLTGSTTNISSLVFSSPTSLISASYEQSVKFWQIGATNPKSIPHTSPIKSITLQAKDGIAISTDSDGVVRIWDLLTGLCKVSFQTPAKSSCLRDVRLIDNKLVLAWHEAKKIHIWDVEKGELLQTVDAPLCLIWDLRISGDGSKVFCTELYFIYAWYIWTGEVMGKVKLQLPQYTDAILTVDSSKVWMNLPDKGIVGWDFGAPDSSSIKHYEEPPNRPSLDFIGGIRKQRSFLPGIENTITGKKVFEPPPRYTKPADAQWDGQYLVAGYDTGEVLILDCNCMFTH